MLRPLVLVLSVLLRSSMATKILSKRNASLAAAYQLLDKGFKEYRQNVRDRYGDEVDKELRYGLVKEKVEEERSI